MVVRTSRARDADSRSSGVLLLLLELLLLELLLVLLVRRRRRHAIRSERVGLVDEVGL